MIPENSVYLFYIYCFNQRLSSLTMDNVLYIELSLKKLGFILPIFATEDGEIISGHQRHYVAKKMGMKKVPVEYIKNIDLKKRKNLNI